MRLVVYGDIGGSGGYVRYCKGLFSGGLVPNDMELWFISSLTFYESLAPLDPRIHVITHPWIISRSRFKRALWYLWVYPRIIKTIKPNIEFYPSGQLRVYLRKALTIATCHNLLLFDKDELIRIENKSERRYFNDYRNMQINSFKKSDALIFLSIHSQKVVCKELPIVRHNRVIPHGLAPIFLFHNKRSYEFSVKIKLLYVSTFYHYKHQLEVVKAVHLLKNETRSDFMLTLVGGGSSYAAKQLNSYVEEENLQDFVTIKGYLSNNELISEYSASDIFVFASSCETFGITLLEAMGTRLPIACSDRTGLPDILRDAGVYFNPEEPRSIADSINELILDRNLRETLGERAYKYAMEYTWEKCAARTFNYIKEIYEE